ncbi:MAG: 5-(carboxyamino)imidazole ribonucleotide mutase [Nitrososphaerales archaeon]
MDRPLVGIIMGSDSDLAVMKDAGQILDSFGVKYELTIVSAHRTPRRMMQYAKTARKRGIKVVIAGAGGAAHLPGMIASVTNMPVIGVPIKTKSLDGLDSLLSIAQMPSGVPVATVAINGAKNAGILACEILGVKHEVIAGKIAKYKEKMRKDVERNITKLESKGVRKYLKNK